jgi:hypothetical protein
MEQKIKDLFTPEEWDALIKNGAKTLLEIGEFSSEINQKEVSKNHGNNQ